LICVKGAGLPWGMLGAAMSDRPTSAGRRVFIALAAAALAVTLTLPRSACESGFAHGMAPASAIEASAVAAAMADTAGHEDAAAPCCAGVGAPAREGALVVVTGESPLPPGAASLALVLLVPLPTPRRIRPRRHPLRGSRSFYLRSARVRR